METREWTTIDKATWGAGPWQREPDKRQWQDEVTGLPCLMVRNNGGGNWCGYVGVPEGHPLHSVSYSDETEVLSQSLADRMQRPVGENPSFAVLLAALSGQVKASPDIVLDVHGGLTFSGGCTAITRETWEQWRARVRGGADEATRYPQGDAARHLREAGAALDDYDAWVAFAHSRYICHLPEPGEPDRVWWFGFDCAHSGDNSPGYERMSVMRGGEYRDVEYVANECRRLAQQLHALAPERPQDVTPA